jgi:putative ABC transport system substrate-binding protein
LAKTSKIQCLGEIGQLRRITVYPFRYYITVGGLISYCSDVVRLSRPAAGYVDRILCQPASAGADKVRIDRQPQGRQGHRYPVPPTLLARADEVIE